MARWLALDHGARRIGLAVADEGSGVATPLGQLPAGAADLARRVARLAQEYAAGGIVVGWPLNDDGSEGPQAAQARRFAAALAGQVDLDVRLWDERLSSFQADRQLAGAFTRKGRKRRHDSVAAAAFLQDFLAAGGPASAPRPTDVPVQPPP